MMQTSAKPMRDVLISRIHERMSGNNDVVFLSADMGAPSLDAVREEFTDRFINVGIAEQNLINVAAGMAMEGVEVFTYAIAPFYLRAYEQIRINLALPAQLRPMNVCMLAMGAGMSYDVSGPTHHCLEDISAMRALANLVTVSPSDWVMARAVADMAVHNARPKYLRLDGKNIAQIYDSASDIDFCRGFTELRRGDRCVIVATGVMVHRALHIAEEFGDDIGVVDAFMLDSCDEAALAEVLSRYQSVTTLEEAFVGRGGLDSLVAVVLGGLAKPVKLRRMGMPNQFNFHPATRFDLHTTYGFGDPQVREAIRADLVGG